MKITEIKNVGGIIEKGKDIFKKLGTPTKGKSTSNTKPDTSVITAQYPAERAAGSDSGGFMSVNDLYKNGTLFVAYDYKTGTVSDFSTMRTNEMSRNRVIDKPTGLKSIKDRVQKQVQREATGGSSPNTNKPSSPRPVANLLMPRSKTDVDTTSHKFNDVGTSLISKGNGTVTGALSSIASNAVFGALDSVTQGIMADHGEQLYTTARSMYGGATNRTKTYNWELVPRSVADLQAILKIYQTFQYLSYGVTGNSEFAKEIKADIDSWYKNNILKKLTIEGANTDDNFMQDITSFLSNVIVVSNPTIWFVKNFGKSSSLDSMSEDIFGPCQIESIRFDRAPDGHFNGLAFAPNMPSSFVLEITFREVLTQNRSTIYGNNLNV